MSRPRLPALLVSLVALSGMAGCDEVFGGCPTGTRGVRGNACFVRRCADGEATCAPGPVLAGAEFELQIRVRNNQATDLRITADRDDGGEVGFGEGSTARQSCFSTQSQAQASKSNDPFGGEECTWQGTIHPQPAGAVRVVVHNQDGAQLDSFEIEVRDPARIEIALERDGNPANIRHRPKERLTPRTEEDASVYELRRDEPNVYVVATAFDVDERALAAFKDAFEYSVTPNDAASLEPGGTLLETDRNLLLHRVTEAELTVTSRNQAPVQATVQLDIRAP